LDIRAMLKIKVKVGKITNLSDARYCAGMGVDMLGFSVGGVHDSMDPKKFKEITDWVSGPDFVIEWAGAALPGDFAEIIHPYNAGMVEINARHLKNIPSLHVPLVVSMEVEDWPENSELLRSSRNRIRYVALTSRNDGPPDFAVAAEIGREFPVLLGYGVNENTLDALSDLPIAGIALEGTEESSPGLKDYSHLSDILERLEI
jgi:phosphoribosylanthranilate isomerase